VAADLKPGVASICYLQPRPRSTPPPRGLADFGRTATLGEVSAVVALDWRFYIPTALKNLKMRQLLKYAYQVETRKLWLALIQPGLRQSATAL
jgi:hypothetical protein